MTFEAYKGLNALNYSTIKQILDNPFYFAKGITSEVSSDSANLGSLCHALILSPQELDNMFIIADIDKLDFRRKADVYLRGEAQMQGKILIDRQTYNHALKIVESCKDFLSPYLLDCDTEKTFTKEIQGVMCKCRCDMIANDLSYVVDLKFVNSATKHDFSQAVAKYKYYIQAYFYMLITNAKEFLFIAIETREPFMLGAYNLDIVTLDFARDKVNEAIALYKQKDILSRDVCYKDLKSNENIQTLTLPAFEFYK